MDCRGTLCLVLGLAGGVAGCTPGTTLPVVPNGQQTAAVTVRKEADLPKRKPQAATCVAFGQFREEDATNPQRTPVEQEQMRDQARKAYQQALDIDPKNLPAARALGRLYAAQGDHGRAVATFSKALKNHPKDAGMWYELGMCHSRQKEWEPALDCLNSAHKLDPENRQYGNALGYCLARSGRYDESLACFTQLVGLAQAHYNLARMLHHMQQDDLSRQHVQLALKADPKLEPAQHLLAQLDGRTVEPSKPVINVGFETVNQ